jgi:YHYH protein
MTAFRHRFHILGMAASLAVTGLLSGPTVAAETVIKPDLFNASALLKSYEVVDCTLSNGDSTKCYQFVVGAQPSGLGVGPFCPETVNETGGMWDWDGDQPGLYALNKAFWTLLKSLGYDFTDDDGSVHIQDPSTARPPGSTPETYKVNYCLERGADSSVEMTIQVPLVPENLSSPTELGTIAEVGIALDGVPIFADAPSVLDTGNLPAVDPCGGHFDPSGYFHWHEVATDVGSMLAANKVDLNCSNVPQSSSALFAYAYDGYPIYGSTDTDGTKPTDLDSCDGHFGPTAEYPNGIYHYHASDNAHNLPPCLMGAVSTKAFVTNAAFGAGSVNGNGKGPGGPRGPGGPGGPGKSGPNK